MTKARASFPTKTSRRPDKDSAIASQDSSAERLLNAGTRLFAERGIDGVAIRDLAKAAGVNVAAVHYHFGGKDELYAAVIERVFSAAAGLREDLKAELARATASTDPAVARDALQSCIRQLILRLFRGSEPSWIGAYLSRESLCPTPSMERVLDSFVRPAWDVFIALLEVIRPDLAGSQKLQFIASSIVGQCFYYQQARPIVLATFNIETIDQRLLEQAIAQVAEFSLAALSHTAPIGKTST